MSAAEERYSALRLQVGLSGGIVGLLFFSGLLAVALGRPDIANLLMFLMIPPLLYAVLRGEKMRKAYIAMRLEQGTDPAEISREWEKINPPGGG